jgi:hypothetical protein
MADFRSRSIVASLVVALVASVAMVGLHAKVDQSLPPEVIDNSKATLPSAESVKLGSLGFEKFLADMFWLAFVQYLGEIRPKGSGFVSAYDYVNLITKLDPHFLKAYWFGCWAIGDSQQRPDLADRIIKEGIQKNPTDWYLPYIGGVNQFLFAQNYPKAAKYYRLAATMKGAPSYLEEQAKIFESPVPELSKRMHALADIYGKTTDEQLKARIKEQLAAIWYDIYQKAPTKTIKANAKKQLEDLGYEVDE